MISMPTNRETQPTTLVHWLHASDFHNHGICPTVCSAFIFCVPHLGAIGILIITVIIMHQSFRFCWSFAPCFALTFPFSFLASYWWRGWRWWRKSRHSHHPED